MLNIFFTNQEFIFGRLFWGRLQHIPSYLWLSYRTYPKSDWL